MLRNHNWNLQLIAGDLKKYRGHVVVPWQKRLRSHLKSGCGTKAQRNSSDGEQHWRAVAIRMGGFSKTWHRTGGREYATHRRAGVLMGLSTLLSAFSAVQGASPFCRRDESPRKRTTRCHARRWMAPSTQVIVCGKAINLTTEWDPDWFMEMTLQN